MRQTYINYIHQVFKKPFGVTVVACVIPSVASRSHKAPRMCGLGFGLGVHAGVSVCSVPQREPFCWLGTDSVGKCTVFPQCES